MLWPTTTTTTIAPGCCKGGSYKANDKCRGFDNDQAQCERKGCEFVVTDDFSECDITTTETPTTTVTPGCCKGTSRTSNDACNAIENPDQCDRRSSCTFIAFGLIDEDCVFPPTEPPAEPGCCYNGDSYKANEKCAKATTRDRCENMGCEFLVTDDPTDCEVTTTETPTTTQTP